MSCAAHDHHRRLQHCCSVVLLTQGDCSIAAVLSLTKWPTDVKRSCAVAKYKQCGGAGGSCKGAQCRDGAWPGATCPKGFTCERVSKWWRYASPPTSSHAEPLHVLHLMPQQLTRVAFISRRALLNALLSRTVVLLADRTVMPLQAVRHARTGGLDQQRGANIDDTIPQRPDGWCTTACVPHHHEE